MRTDGGQRLPRIFPGNSEIIEKVIDRVPRGNLGHGKVVGTLRPGQADAAHQKMVLTCLSAEDRMILDDQAAPRTTAELLVLVGGHQATETATDDHHVIKLARVLHRRRIGLAEAVTDPLR
mgnify:CR=1 FL=1